MSFDEWVVFGVEQGFCWGPWCVSHDGTPFDECEAVLFEAGDDPCVVVLKLVGGEL